MKDKETSQGVNETDSNYYCKFIAIYGTEVKSEGESGVATGQLCVSLNP